MMKRKILSCLALGSLLLGTAQAADLLVPGTYANVTAAYTAAAEGDRILITDQGTYNETVLNLQKSISIISEPPGATINITGTGGVQGLKINKAGGTFLLKGFKFGGRRMRVDAAPASLTLDNIQNTGVWNSVNLEEAVAVLAGAGAVITIKDCVFTGSGANNKAQFLINNGPVSKLIVSNTVFKDGLENGLAINNKVDEIQLSGCTFRNHAGKGLQIDFSATGSVMTATNCVIDGCGRNLLLARPCTARVEGTTITASKAAGVFFQNYEPVSAPGQTSLTLNKCVILNNALQGVDATCLNRDANDLNLTITGCTIGENGSEAIRVQDDAAFTAAPNALIAGNKLYDNSNDSGLKLVGLGAGSRVVNNLIDCHKNGLELARSSAQIYHNTIVSDAATTTTVGLRFDAPTTAAAVLDIRNNLIANVGTGAAVSTDTLDLAGVTFDTNLVQASQANLDAAVTARAGTHNLLGIDPAFQAASNTAGAGNYNLSMMGSPAINAADATAAVAVDLAGRLRPQPVGTAPDLGAFEDYLLTPVELSNFSAE